MFCKYLIAFLAFAFLGSVQMCLPRTVTSLHRGREPPRVPWWEGLAEPWDQLCPTLTRTC